jgi:hypothetical protein
MLSDHIPFRNRDLYRNQTVQCISSDSLQIALETDMGHGKGRKKNVQPRLT